MNTYLIEHDTPEHDTLRGSYDAETYEEALAECAEECLEGREVMACKIYKAGGDVGDPAELIGYAIVRSSGVEVVSKRDWLAVAVECAPLAWGL